MHDLVHALVRSPKLPRQLRLREAQCVSRPDDPVVHFATAELDAVEGNDWPRNRDGENFALVPVAL